MIAIDKVFIVLKLSRPSENIHHHLQSLLVFLPSRKALKLFVRHRKVSVSFVAPDLAAPRENWKIMFLPRVGSSFCYEWKHFLVVTTGWFLWWREKPGQGGFIRLTSFDDFQCFLLSELSSKFKSTQAFFTENSLARMLAMNTQACSSIT